MSWCSRPPLCRAPCPSASRPQPWSQPLPSLPGPVASALTSVPFLLMGFLRATGASSPSADLASNPAEVWFPCSGRSVPSRSEQRPGASGGRRLSASRLSSPSTQRPHSPGSSPNSVIISRVPQLRLMGCLFQNTAPDLPARASSPRPRHRLSSPGFQSPLLEHVPRLLVPASPRGRPDPPTEGAQGFCVPTTC